MNTVAPVRPDKLNADGEVDYLCPAAHRVYGDNVLWRKKRNGRTYPACRECKRTKRAEYQRRDEVKARSRVLRRNQRLKKSVTSVYSSSGDEIPLEDYLGAEKRSVPWNLLRPRIEASGAFDEFHEALKYTAVPCRGRTDEFTEYQDPRPGRDDDSDGRLAMPSREQARQMCAPCPLLEMCGNYAHLDRPDFGVWGGQRYLGGRVV